MLNLYFKNLSSCFSRYYAKEVIDGIERLNWTFLHSIPVVIGYFSCNRLTTWMFDCFVPAVILCVRLSVSLSRKPPPNPPEGGGLTNRYLQI